MKHNYKSTTHTYKINGREHRIRSDQALSFSLQGIPGLGFYLSKQICYQLGISPELTIENLTTKQKNQIFRMLTDHYTVGEQVKLQSRESIGRHIRIGSYRGLRLRDGLPVRGQRTHSNAHTARKFKISKFTRD